MARKRMLTMMVLFFGITLAFTLFGCNTGTNGDDDDGGLSKTEQEAAKNATLEEYSNDPEGFADFVSGLNYVKGWSLPSNPNNWSASQWGQYYSYINEQQGKNGSGKNNSGNYTSPEWPVQSEITSLIGTDYSKMTALGSASTWGQAAEILGYANVGALVNAIIAKLESTEGPVAGIYEYQNGKTTPLNPITASTPFNYYSGRILVVWD